MLIEVVGETEVFEGFGIVAELGVDETDEKVWVHGLEGRQLHSGMVLGARLGLVRLKYRLLIDTKERACGIELRGSEDEAIGVLGIDICFKDGGVGKVQGGRVEDLFVEGWLVEFDEEVCALEA